MNHADSCCPRCGYDLSGQTAAWGDTCDVHGTCPECGLAFRWGDLLNDEFAPPGWHVEHPIHRRLGGVARTLVRTLAPGRFWGASSMERLARGRRAVLYAVAAVLLVLAVTGPAEYAVWFVTDHLFANPPRSLASPREAPIGGKPLLHISDAIMALQPTHIWSWTMQDMTKTLGIAVELPVPYAEPNMGLVAPYAVFFAIPLTYLALPMTLGAARIRAVHLLRAVCYGLPVSLLLWELLVMVSLFVATLLRTFPFVDLSGVSEMLIDRGLLWLVVVPLHQWIWWSAVNRRYLRLEQPRRVTAAMLIIGSLAGLIVTLHFTTIGMDWAIAYW